MLRLIDQLVLWVRKQHIRLADRTDTIVRYCWDDGGWGWYLPGVIVAVAFIAISILVFVPFMPWYFGRKLELIVNRATFVPQPWDTITHAERARLWIDEDKEMAPPLDYRWQEEGF